MFHFTNDTLQSRTFIAESATRPCEDRGGTSSLEKDIRITCLCVRESMNIAMDLKVLCSICVQIKFESADPCLADAQAGGTGEGTCNPGGF